MKTTPENITQLKPNEIFVFGSNLAGVHGAGAARLARLAFGAIGGVGVGPTGCCYAIPTKDERIETMALNEIEKYVDEFLKYAAAHLEHEFLVTKIGCGLAGYSPDEVGRLFEGKSIPENVSLPVEFRP